MSNKPILDGMSAQSFSLRCKAIHLHNLPGTKSTDKCRWCRKTVKEITEAYELEN